MTVPLAAAMRTMEARRFEEAAAGFARIAGPSDEGVIARFRRAECLSRLGRHDEAIDEARRAHADAPETPATGVWLAQTLAEAGKYGDAAAVRMPPQHEEFVGPIARGYEALVRLADDVPDGRDEVSAAILGARHHPLHSLALRLTERRRLRAEPRWPDLPTVSYRHDCAMEMAEDGVTEHPTPPRLDGREDILGRFFGRFLGRVLGRFVRRSQASDATRWFAIHAACGDWTGIVARVRAERPDDASVGQAELEMLLALGRIDDADTLASKFAADAGAKATGELAIDRARIGQIRGKPARPRDFEGFDDARRRLAEAVAWLDCCACLIEGDEPGARAAADRVADPSHAEYVEAALLRWQG